MKEEKVLRIEKSFTFGWNETVKSQPSGMNGEIKHIHLRVPNFVNPVTAALSLEDVAGYEVYNSGAKAENTNHNIDRDQLIDGNFSFKVTLSGAPGIEGPPASDPATVVAVIYYYGRD